MAYCRYCNTQITATLCNKYYDHVNICGKNAENAAKVKAAKIEIEKLKEKHERDLAQTELKIAREYAKNAHAKNTYMTNASTNIMNINNYHVAGDMVVGTQNKLCMDYPQNDFISGLLNEAKTIDLTKVNSVEKLDAYVEYIQNQNDSELVKNLNGNDKKAKVNTLSFLADVMTVVHERLRAANLGNEVVEAADDFRKECLDDKQKITVEDVD